MKILGIIPARGSSKRLPKKNLADLGGRPLIQWTLDAALDSKIFDELWISSEDPEIGRVAGKYWWRRKPELALDSTPTMPVILDIFDNSEADIVFTLQPTSPFRTSADIKKSLDLLIKNNADSVISTVEAQKDLAFEVGWANRLRSIPNVVVPNGAIYIITAEALRRGETWYTGLLYSYSMEKDKSIDIDTPQDLELARHLVKLNGHSK